MASKQPSTVQKPFVDAAQADLIGRIEADYDAFAYESHAFPHTHPSKMAAIAKLFGVDAVPVERARILELGCASGGNIAPLAVAYPKAQVVGFDLSREQIADGKRAIADLKLQNLTLEQGNILSLPEGLGEFDYIVCHGVFSWVPKAVQQGIFDVLRNHLSPNGVGFISYNVFPGWHFRGSLRQMMLIHCARFDTPQKKVAEARNLVNLLAETSTADSPFGKFLRAEREQLKGSQDSYIFHEYLEGVNEPEYFKDWLVRAEGAGLKYLSEAEHFTSYSHWLHADAQKAVAEIADRAMYEQYVDFFRNRTFRQSLLIRAETPMLPQPDPSVVRQLVASGRFTTKTPVDYTQPSRETYASHTGIEINITHTVSKAACAVLSDCWPRQLSFDALLRAAHERLRAEGGTPMLSDDVRLAGDLFSMFTWNTVELRSGALELPERIGDKPKGFAWARWEIQTERARIGTLRHEAASINPAARLVLQLSDGTRTRDELADELLKREKFGVVRIPDAFAAPKGADDKARWSAMRRFVEACLNEMLPMGLYAA